MRLQIIYGGGHSTGFIGIVRVDPCEDVTRGARESFVDGLGLAAIFAALYVDIPFLPF